LTYFDPKTPKPQNPKTPKFEFKNLICNEAEFQIGSWRSLIVEIRSKLKSSPDSLETTMFVPLSIIERLATAPNIKPPFVFDSSFVSWLSTL